MHNHNHDVTITLRRKETSRTVEMSIDVRRSNSDLCLNVTTSEIDDGTDMIELSFVAKSDDDYIVRFIVPALQ